MSPKSVLLLGATGLVGGACLKLLVEEPVFSRIIVLTRRALPLPPASQVEQHRIDFDDPATFRPYLNVDVVICALGTTIRKAGSQEAFRKVDYEYPLRFARLAREAGARHYLLVSSMGADPRSRVFYSRVKGEVEAAIRALDYPAVTIFRPSLLLGPRPELRVGEAVGQRVFGALRPLLPRAIRAVPATAVARAVVRAAAAEASGVRIVTNAEMV